MEHLKLTHGIGEDVLALDKMPGVDGKKRENVQQTGNFQSVDDSGENVAHIDSFITDGAQFCFHLVTYMVPKCLT